jgi:mRNA-degrading endonuclease toxin of MazEF toxin-antitoxin module
MENSLKHSTKELKKGEIWLAKDEKSQKVRPFIILSDELSGIDVDVSVAPSSTQAKRNDFDVDITKWQEAGLREPSIARCSKVHYMYHALLVRKIGTLHEKDLQEIDKALIKFFGLNPGGVE